MFFINTNSKLLFSLKLFKALLILSYEVNVSIYKTYLGSHSEINLILKDLTTIFFAKMEKRFVGIGAPPEVRGKSRTMWNCL
jgi:hypothetical protein